MKILRYVVMAALILGISGVANAFQFSVLDPQDPNPYPVLPGVPFSVQFFADCPSVLGGPESGCFFAINNSSTVTLTSLQLVFPDNGPGGTDGQNVFCVTTSSASLFAQSNCSLANGVYTLDLYGGTGIAPGQEFALVEDCDINGDCVPPANFPVGNAVANTPEPNSIWMALSGMGSLGYLLRRRRKILAR
jgi:hypothetical protein